MNKTTTLLGQVNHLIATDEAKAYRLAKSILAQVERPPLPDGTFVVFDSVDKVNTTVKFIKEIMDVDDISFVINELTELDEYHDAWIKGV